MCMSDEDSERMDMTPGQLADAVAFLGCSEAEGDIGDAVIEWFDDAHAGPGWYIYCGEYPDEGCSLISKQPFPSDELTRLLTLQEQRDCPTPSAGAGSPSAGGERSGG